MPRREGEVLRLGTAIFRTPAIQAATGSLAERERKREARLIHANARQRQPRGEMRTLLNADPRHGRVKPGQDGDWA